MVLTCKDEFASVCWVPLKVQKKNIDEWIAVMTLNTTPGDEIALFALCKVYFKHAAIVTKYSTWTSIDRIDLDEDELLRTCDITLLYMGPGLFGQLVPKNNCSKPHEYFFVRYQALGDEGNVNQWICRSVHVTQHGVLDSWGEV